MTPIPLLVASRSLDEAAVARLRQALLSCDAAPDMSTTLDVLLIARFAQIDAAAYEILPKWAREADAAAVPAPGASAA
jgi:ABC-type phosphate/phosphonate transport system substrate-binding protein